VGLHRTSALHVVLKLAILESTVPARYL